MGTISDKYKDHFRIPSNRLREWDYASIGYYFVTVCVKDRKCVLGEINDKKMCQSNIGNVVQDCWTEIPKHFHNVKIDEFVVMPNHVHGIVHIVETCHGMSLPNQFTKPYSGSLGMIMNHFKGAATRNCIKRNIPFTWQPRYYDHIIRDEKSLHSIREYIQMNPLKWAHDEENPTTQ